MDKNSPIAGTKGTHHSLKFMEMSQTIAALQQFGHNIPE
jgi:hypothetical protein